MSKSPMLPSWPSFSQEEADAVSRVLLSNKVNAWTGNECQSFEREFASATRSDHAIAIANGTLALELSLMALVLQPGDEVIVTARSFVASASAIVNVGATPVFVDVCPSSGNVTAASIEPSITERTRAILCVHLAGWPCEMTAILALAKKHQLWLIEDCAQAHGAEYRDRPVGSIGDVAAWSFCQDKIITTGGEGGMVTTQNALLADRIRSLKDHGKNFTKLTSTPGNSSFRFVHDSFGTNARLTEMQAAIGRIQLKKLPQWVEQRRENAQHIWERASSLQGLRVPQLPNHIVHSAYKCYLYLIPERLKPGWDRDRILSELNAAGIPCQSGSCPEMYLENCFRDAGLGPDARLPQAKLLGETSLMLPVHPTLSSVHIEWFCDTLQQVMKHACNK